jgi:5-formyltetrahydrofolate cyclo-ligase
VRRAAAAVCAHVLALAEYRSARLVHVYLASLDNELGTRGIVAASWAQGKDVAVPVVRPGSRVLAHAIITPQDVLERDRWGLLGPRPQGARWLQDPGAIDVVFVPGLAFDRRGCRLGVGGGYYDRFLAGIGATRVGLTYDELVLPRIPEEPHDARMDAVVSPQGVIRCGHD